MEELKEKEFKSETEQSLLYPSGKHRFWDKYLNKKFLFIFKIIVTGIILWLIFRRIDFQEVISTAVKLKIYLFGLLIIISVLKFITQMKNWERCLRITAEYQPAQYEIIKSHFIGQALRFLVPGGHAAFAKIYFVTNKKKATLFSIGIERFMQTWTNLWFASWAGFFFFRQLPLLVRVIVLLMVTILPLIIYWSSRILKRNSWKEYFNQYIKLVPVITLRQILFVFLTILQYYLIISQFQEIGFTSIMLSVPLILVANLIPITYAGLGLRETFAIHVLSVYEIEPAIAVTASLVIFMLNAVLPALVGAFFLITSRSSIRKKGK